MYRVAVVVHVTGGRTKFGRSSEGTLQRVITPWGMSCHSTSEINEMVMFIALLNLTLFPLVLLFVLNSPIYSRNSHVVLAIYQMLA